MCTRMPNSDECVIEADASALRKQFVILWPAFPRPTIHAALGLSRPLSSSTDRKSVV